MAPSEIVQSSLLVMIRDRNGVLFEGSADSVSSYNDQGLFDILPLHSSFISLIHTMITVRAGGVIIRKIPLQSAGVAKVWANVVEVYLGILH